MGKIGEDADASPVRMEKKSKKSKDQISEDADASPVKMKKKSKKSKNRIREDADAVPVKMEKKSKKSKNQIREDADADPVKMEKKSKKSKNKTNDQLDFGDDNSHLKEKGHKHRDKKRKSESNEDEDRLHKSNLEDDCGSRKKDKKKRKIDSSENAEIKENEQGQDDGSAVDKDCDPKPRKQKKKHRSLENELENCVIDKKKKKRKKKTINQDSDPAKDEIMSNLEKKPKPKGKSKRVSFSGHVEVFPSSDTDSKNKKTGDGLVRGKRFTPEEDAIVKEAVLNYVTARDLGDDGLKMVLNCNSHPGMKKCWQEIGTCIPYRPYTAVYYRAHILFERAENRSWTPEEIEFLKEFHEKNGNNWKMAADELGKHRFHVKDTWRRIKLKNLKLGQWSQEEYQSLYDLVNLDLQMKINCEAKQSKHGMLRDNIPWTAISEKLSTRSDATCCTKWYNQLTSSLVAEKKWCDADDYRLIGALYELDAACEEDVEWDDLLEHRSGEVCRKRWNQMVRHIGHQGSKPFAEQVDMLAKRYCPDLAETREAWDNKPVVS